jgi:hypothetical protein
MSEQKIKYTDELAEYYSLSDSSAFILQRLSNPIFKKSPTFLSKTLDKPIKKCGASRLLINKNRPLAAVQNF